MRRASCASCAFSLLELLVAISILAVLAGLLLVSLGMLRRSQQRAITLDLMNHVTSAVTTYLTRWPTLGDQADAADFVADPWRFLARNLVASGRPPLLELTERNLVRCELPEGQRIIAITDGSLTADIAAYAASGADAPTHIRDAFGGGEVLRWKVVNRTLAGTARRFTVEIELRSRCGTDDPKDDLVQRFAVDGPGSTHGQWLHGD